MCSVSINAIIELTATLARVGQEGAWVWYLAEKTGDMSIRGLMGISCTDDQARKEGSLLIPTLISRRISTIYFYTRVCLGALFISAHICFCLILK